MAEVKPKGKASAPCRSRATTTIKKTNKTVEMIRLMPDNEEKHEKNTCLKHEEEVNKSSNNGTG